MSTSKIGLKKSNQSGQSGLRSQYRASSRKRNRRESRRWNPRNAAAVSAITAKAKLAGLWREKIDQHSTGTVSTVWHVSWEDEEDGGNPDG